VKTVQNIIFFLLITQTLFAQMTAFNIYPTMHHTTIDNKIRILDAKELEFHNPKISELSGLVYKKGYLYALSDQGYLAIFKLTLHNDKITKLTLVHKYVLRKKNAALHSHDSEGLAFKGTDLLISFERKQRVDLYSTKGVKISKMKINKALRDQKEYESKNKGLEGVAYNKKYGIVTAPEKPLKNVDAKFQRLYSRFGIYKFKAKGSITGLEFIDKDNILVLLRQFDYFPLKRVTSLVKVDLSKCTKEHICKSELLAAFSSDKGWNIDNFEGVTKVGKNRYLMVSDDNDNIFQKTLLVLFEIRR